MNLVGFVLEKIAMQSGVWLRRRGLSYCSAIVVLESFILTCQCKRVGSC